MSRNVLQPMKLQDIIYKFICNNLAILGHPDENCEGALCLNSGIVLPNKIWCSLQETYKQVHHRLDDKFNSLFRYRNRTSVKIMRKSIVTKEEPSKNDAANKQINLL